MATPDRTTRLPEPPACPEWFGEAAYADLRRAYERARAALVLAEHAEAQARCRRALATAAVRHYDGLLDQIAGQLTIDDA